MLNSRYKVLYSLVRFKGAEAGLVAGSDLPWTEHAAGGWVTRVRRRGLGLVIFKSLRWFLK
jgi:hypothetical protein